MSLYYLQKLLYHVNREPHRLAGGNAPPGEFLDDYDLTAEERQAVLSADIGLLYVLGVNGQILMHYAAACGFPWEQYIQMMKDGVAHHGPVREGLYAMAEDGR